MRSAACGLRISADVTEELTRLSLQTLDAVTARDPRVVAIATRLAAAWLRALAVDTADAQKVG